MFSLLNIYTTDFDEAISVNRVLNNIQNPKLFKKANKMIKSGIPCINLKKLNFDFECMNMWLTLYNIGYFFYDNSVSKNEERKSGNIRRSILDYLSYKGDIIKDDFLRLNDLTIYEHEYDYDDLFYLVKRSESYYENSVYLYFIKNYILLSGRELNENSNYYNEVVSLNSESITREIHDGILKSIERIENIRMLYNYRHFRVFRGIDKKDYVNFVRSVLKLLKYYFKELDLINVKYHKDLSEIDDIEGDTSGGEQVISHDHQITYFICVDRETNNFLINFRVSYTFYEMVDGSYYRMPGSPLNIKVVFIKYEDFVKVRTHIIIDENMRSFKNVQIEVDKNMLDNKNHKYRESRIGGYYHLVIFSELRNEYIPNISDITTSIKQIKSKVGARKIHIM